MTGLYIHVPFCISRCRYCDFYKETAKEWADNGRFLKSLEVELSRLPDTFVPDTIFIGGGTPTALAPDEYARMLESIHRQINLSNVSEFSSEANPGTLTPEKLSVMKDGGVNRVSIGVQSFNDRALQLLGRIHSSSVAIEGFYMLREAGFDNVNIDLIQSIPGMSSEEVLDDARKVVELGPEHISFYNLIYEPGTSLTAARDAGRVVPPGDEEEADNYFLIKAFLEKAGYDHYEISNFSKSGYQCLHNVLYWQGGEYFGCGPSAHSHWSGRRFGNLSDLKFYCERMENGVNPFDEIEILGSEEKARETLVMWLRMTGGVPLDAFKSATGYSVDELCGSSLAHLTEEGLLKYDGEVVALTPEALFVCNAVFSDLV
ncbi:MAG TPA: radical SAM family heme chaperone HemW [Pontiella sp.]